MHDRQKKKITTQNLLVQQVHDPHCAADISNSPLLPLLSVQTCEEHTRATQNAMMKSEMLSNSHKHPLYSSKKGTCYSCLTSILSPTIVLLVF